MAFPRPSDLVDKLITLSLKILLAILLKVLYIIKGEEIKITKLSVTIKKENEEKQYTHIIEASKEREIIDPNLTQSDINEQDKTEEVKTEPNLVTGTPSELEPEEFIKEGVIDEDEGSISDSSSESSFEAQEEHEIPYYPLEMKTSYGNSNELDVLPVQVFWNHGGQDVIVTGDFDNWQGTHKMSLDPTTQTFVANINVNRNKQHEYKFIVDGDWRPNYDLPTSMDEHGNVNNIVYAFPSGPLNPEYKEYTAPFSQLTAAY